MLKNFMKSTIVATGLVAGITAGSANAAGSSLAWGDIVKTGNAGGTINVTSGDGQSWTSITSSQFSFPVAFTAHGLEIDPLNRVWVVQGETLDVNFRDIYDTDDPGTGLQGPTFHSDTKTLFGGTLKLTNNERNQIIASCNAKLKPFANEQPQHQTEMQIPVSMVMQTTNDGVGWSDGVAPEGIDYGESWKTVNFTLPVICEGFMRETPATPDKLAVDPDSANIVQVELGLSTNGNAVVGGPLEYTGSCPMGITLNMRWVTNIGTGLKSYIKHKDLAGAHNWTSQEFSVTTSEPAYGGNWKKEMTDLIAIPFAGSVPSNGPGGANANNQPGGGLMFNPGGNGGGLNPATSVGAGNTGTNDGLIQYIGYFKLVAYKNKQIVTLPAVGGGTEDVTVYDAYKSSDWRKYIVTCEPKQSTVALDSPKDLVNPPKTGVFNPDDGPAFPRPAPKIDTAFDPATRDLTGPTAHMPDAPQDTNGKTTALKEVNPDVPDRIKELAAEARRKQAARKKQGDVKRVNNAAIKAQQMKLNADAARHAAQAKAKKAAAQRRAVIAAELARKRDLEAQKKRTLLQALQQKRRLKVAPKRTTTTTTAPVINQRVMRVR